MKGKANLIAERAIRIRKRKDLRRRVLALLSAGVLFITMNRLTFAADTLERKPACGLEEHVHTAECYNPEEELICSQEAHEHTDACYQERPKKEAEDIEETEEASDFELTEAVETEEVSPEDAPVEMEAFELGGDEEQMDEEDSDVEETVADETSEYRYIVGSQCPVYLETILEQVGLDIEGPLDAGQVMDDDHPEDLIHIEKDDNGVAIYPIRDFDKVELAVMTDNDIYVITLLDAFLPLIDDAIVEENVECPIEETEKPTAVDNEAVEIQTEVSIVFPEAPTETENVAENTEEDNAEDVNVLTGLGDENTEADSEESGILSEVTDETVPEDENEENTPDEVIDTNEPETEKVAEPETENEAADEANTETGKATCAATIDLHEAAEPFSLVAWIEEVLPEDAGNARLSADAWTVEYDAELLNIEAADQDYTVEPLVDFEETKLTVDTGDATIELTLMNRSEVEEEAEADLDAIQPATFAATIDLADAATPCSLADWMAQALPEDAKVEPVPAQNWFIEYDAEALAIEPEADDYTVEPVADFNETLVNIIAGEASYALTVLNGSEPERLTAAVLVDDMEIEVEGANYSLLISVPAEAELPETAEFRAWAITDAYYQDSALAAVAEDDSREYTLLALFDLTIYDGDQVIQPKAPISVSVNFGDELSSDTRVYAVHFPGTGAQPQPEPQMKPMFKAPAMKLMSAPRTSMRALPSQGLEVIEEEVAQEAPELNIDTEEIETIHARNDHGMATFEASSFSYYALVSETIVTEFTLPGSDTLYEVSVTYGPEAGIPDGSTLEVTALAEDSKEYINAKAAVVAAKKAADERFNENTLGLAALDITIRDAEGNKVEPAAEVTVSLRMKQLPEGVKEETLAETLEIQHLNESTGEVVVETVAGVDDVAVADGAAEAEFTLGSFSTFTLTWGENKATVHFGKMNGTTFEEFDEESINFDTSATSINIANTFDGYTYLEAVYCANGQSIEQGVDMDSILYRTSSGWELTQYTSSSDGEGTVSSRTTVANGSDIYAVYYVPESPNPSGADDIKIPSPTTTKNVTDNRDGTYTIQLDVTGATVTEDNSHYANILVILDATRSMNGSKWTNAKAAMKTLVETLVEGENAANAGKIDFALVTFGRAATVTQNWTKDNAAFKRTCANVNMVSTSGTNWEAGMRGGLYGVLNNMPDDDPTFVIFLTDGDPNVYYSSGSATNYTNTGTTNGYNQNANTSASRSADEAKAIAAKTKLYGIYCGDSGTTPSGTSYNRLVSVITGSGQGGVKTIAANADTIESEFKVIAETALASMGANNVSVDDGVPSLSSVSAQTVGGAGAFEYYIATGENPSDSDFSTWTDAPGASYSNDNGVTWDLSKVGTLPEKTTYRLKFTVWPSQEALDLIANLNNSAVTMTDDELEAASITKGADGKYTLKTNSHLNTTYTFKGDTYTDPKTPLPSGDMLLPSDQMTVRKVFAHTINSQDPFTSIVFYLKQDGAYYQKDGTTSAALDESKVYELPVNTGNNWKNSVYIAPGFMRGGEVLETGHKYTLEEKVLVGNAYEYEFTPQTVRPMIIDGTLTYLVLKDKYNTNPNKAKEYTIDDETYYVASENNGELVGTNRKTGELDITKVVETNGILTDAEEAEETFTYRVTLQIPDGSDPAGIVGYEYVYRPDQANAYYLYGYHRYEGGDPVATAFEDDIARLGNNKYRAWNTLVYRDLVEWESIDGRIVSKKDADGNIIWKVPASGGYHAITYDMTLKQNEIIRFTNLPSGTKYTIQEIYANKYPADNVGGDTAGKAPVSDPGNIASEGYAISVKSTAGTVSQTAVANDTVSGTIDGLDTRFYNQFTNTMTKAVDVNLKGTKRLEGYDWSGESYHFTLATTGSNPMPAEASGKTGFDLSAASGRDDLTDTFGRIRFTAAGTYTYTVSETHSGTLQVVNGKAVQFGDAVTITIEIEENETKHDLSVKSVTGTGVAWDADSRTATATITNTAPTTEVKAAKAWLNADGTTNAPDGAKVTFTLYADGTATEKTVELDGTVDENGEAVAWEATFSDLQQYKVEDGKAVEIIYTVFEEDSGSWKGYDRINTEPVADGGTITNRQSTLWVQFRKADSTNQAWLAGAVFTFNNGTSDITITSGEDGIMATTPAAGEEAVNKFELAIRQDPYVLTETHAPDGYNMLTSVVNVSVTADGVRAMLNETGGTNYIVTGTGTEADPYVVIITNQSGYVLPSTGGIGTTVFTMGGLTLVGLALFLLMKKRMALYN